MKESPEGFSSEDIESVQSPTPSALLNRLLAFTCTYEGLEMVSLDIVSAFLHAEEASPDVYMWPPQEWEEAEGVPHRSRLWAMIGNMYGRRSAPSNFRELFQSVVEQLEGFSLRRGTLEPCLFFCPQSGVRITHHVDDVRVIAKPAQLDKVIHELSKHFLLKVTTHLKIGTMHRYLNRDWIREPTGWTIVPDGKHAKKVLSGLDLDQPDRKPKSAATPGVAQEITESALLSPEQTSEYRSMVGSLIYLSMDIEELAFSIKELARTLSKPTQQDWMRLKR
eukprot:3851031-Amphidinium_carterae.1